MQTQKNNIRQIILKTSRKEFLAKGFKNASMRSISKDSGVGLSNIYNYFKNKEEILLEILRPLLQSLDQLLNEHNSSKHLDIHIFTSEEYQKSHINLYVELILKYKDEFNLLLFKSHGSSLENYRDEYTDRHTSSGTEYLNLMKEKYPRLNSDISDFFIHTMSSWWLTIIGEIVSHDL